MVVFRIGEPYPVHNEANGQEKTRADFTPRRLVVEQAISRAEMMPLR